MGPTFSKKHGKLYHYYLCVHASKNGYDSCPTRTLSAREIEGVAISQLREVLRAPELLAQTYREARARAQADEQAVQCEPFSERDVVDALSSLDPIWDHLFPDEQARIVQLLVKQVDLYPGRAELRTEQEVAA